MPTKVEVLEDTYDGKLLGTFTTKRYIDEMDKIKQTCEKKYPGYIVSKGRYDILADCFEFVAMKVKEKK